MDLHGFMHGFAGSRAWICMRMSMHGFACLYDYWPLDYSGVQSSFPVHGIVALVRGPRKEMILREIF